MIKRLIGIVVLLLLGFLLFVCLSGFGMLIAVVFLVMHPAVIVLGTMVSSFMVLLHLMTKENKAP